MQITIELPDKLTAKMQDKWGNIPKKILTNILLEAYQNQLISTAELGEMLNLSTRLEVHQFLKDNGIYLNYDETELNQDLLTIKNLRN
jgi:predicted HTH domain antitoxin